MKQLFFVLAIIGLSSIFFSPTLTAQNELLSYANPAEHIYKYYEVDEQPEFPGGLDKLVQYIDQHLNYPIPARENAIEGKVKVMFVIDQDGETENMRILKSLDDGCDAEVIRILKSMPNWKPGIKDGQQVTTKLVLNVRFDLGL